MRMCPGESSCIFDSWVDACECVQAVGDDDGSINLSSSEIQG